MLVLPVIRLRGPRQSWRCAARQPGTTACLAVLVGTACGSCVVAGTLLIAWTTTPGRLRIAPDDWLRFFLRDQLIAGAGLAVANVWIVQILSRRWRPEPRLDRSPRPRFGLPLDPLRIHLGLSRVFSIVLTVGSRSSPFHPGIPRISSPNFGETSLVRMEGLLHMTKTTAPNLSRRRMLQISGMGTFGASLAAALKAQANASNMNSASQPIRSCILIFYYGGPSHLDTWDMKPNAPGRRSAAILIDRHERPRHSRLRAHAAVGESRRSPGHRAQRASSDDESQRRGICRLERSQPRQRRSRTLGQRSQRSPLPRLDLEP